MGSIADSQQHVERIVRHRMSERVIALRPHDIKTLGGMAEAAFMQQLCFHCTNKPDDWFYHTASQIEDETTLSVDQQQRVRKKLVALGVLEEERRGTPAKLYYRVIWSVLANLLYPPMPNQDSENHPILNRTITQTNKNQVVDSSPSEKADGRKPYEMWTWWKDALNITDATFTSKNGRNAKDLIARGFGSKEQFMELLAWLQSDPWKVTQGIDLAMMVGNVDKFRAAQSPISRKPRIKDV